MKFPAYRETVMAQSKLGRHICKAILYYHGPTIFTSNPDNARTDICDLIGFAHMATCIADEHLFVRDKEWGHLKENVLSYFEMPGQELLKLKGDVLALVNGE